MKSKQTYAVVGLKSYGMAVAKELVLNGMEVLAIDTDEDIVNMAISDIPICKCANITEPGVIKQLGIENIDTVILAMSSNLEASILATVMCKEAGVKRVIVKASNEMHCRILEKVGADKVVFPERESGERLAKNLLSSGFVDMIELAKDVSIIDIDVKPEWVGKNLLELDLRKKYGINIVAIKQGTKVIINIDPKKPLEDTMNLIVIANASKLGKLS